MALVKLNNGKQVNAGDDVKKFLIDKLIRKAEELGRTPEFADVADDPLMPNPNTYSQFWRSFTDAVKSIIPVERQIDDSEDELEEDESDDLGTKPETKLEAREQGKTKWRKPYGEGQIEMALKNFFWEHKRLPTNEEMVLHDELPSPSTVKIHLGPRSEWGAKLEIDISENKAFQRSVNCGERFTDQQIFLALKRSLDEQGRFPYRNELKDYGLPSRQTLEIRIGAKEYWTKWYIDHMPEFLGA